MEQSGCELKLQGYGLETEIPRREQEGREMYIVGQKDSEQYFLKSLKPHFVTDYIDFKAYPMSNLQILR